MSMKAADSLIESLLDCPDDNEVGLKNAKEVGIKGNDDTVIVDFWRHCKESLINFVNSEPTVDSVKAVNPDRDIEGKRL